MYRKSISHFSLVKKTSNCYFSVFSLLQPFKSFPTLIFFCVTTPARFYLLKYFHNILYIVFIFVVIRTDYFLIDQLHFSSFFFPPVVDSLVYICTPEAGSSFSSFLKSNASITQMYTDIFPF